MTRQVTHIQVMLVPELFSVAQLDVGSLFNKLGVSLQEVDSPAGVFLQVIKLILKHKTRQTPVSGLSSVDILHQLTQSV